MEEPTSAKTAARDDAESAGQEEAWRAAQAQWLVEIQRPPRDRGEFQIREVAQALAQKAGRLEEDLGERQRIVLDIFEWAKRGEFDEPDVLMLSGQPELFEPFLPAYRAEVEAIEAAKGQVKLWYEIRPCGAHRPAIALPGEGAAAASLERALASVMYRGFVDINVEAIVLRRPAVQRYLESSGLEGAPRVFREWFAAAEDAIPELAQSKEPTAPPATSSVETAVDETARPRSSTRGRKPGSGSIDDRQKMNDMLHFLATSAALSVWSAAGQYSENNESTQRRLHRKFKGWQGLSPAPGKTWKDVVDKLKAN